MDNFAFVVLMLTQFVISNPNIPVSEQNAYVSKAIALTEQYINQPIKKEVEPVVVNDVLKSVATEPTSSIVEPVATSTSTTTQYRAGTVRVDGGKVIFNKGDADVFRTKFTLTKGDGIEEGKPHYNISDLRANPNTAQEQVDDWSTQETEGTLWIFSSRKGVILDERTYNFKVEKGIATLY